MAAAAMAALTASQAPGAQASPTGGEAAPAAPERPGVAGVAGDGAYRTELPPLRARGGSGTDRVPDGNGAAAGAAGDLPATVLAAYRRAETSLATETAGCGLRWQLLAAIGQVESGHAYGGRVGPDGTALAPILGPRLDGNGFAAIRDTDGGRYDGDVLYDRAVGPMQFIPSTWAVWGADGNGDGTADPQNVHDAALAAGRYLCAGGRDLADPYGLDRAILAYNHSTAYLRTVRAWFAYYLDGHRVVPDRHGGAAGARPSSPESSRPARPQSPPPAAPSSPAPAASPSAPSGTHPAGGQGEQQQTPVIPLPGTGVELPGDGALPSTTPLVGNGTDSMAATPSTSLDTQR
ncbi:lytic transglycosylase domain-containing protein [Streptomyces sp. NPDC059909]|uniref:lytic transglycosylase domain-containing protein n=1 Tax=Streptomyces sp. NPDC059909 TaxID=3346998 RepID=UPI00364601AA